MVLYQPKSALCTSPLGHSFGLKGHSLSALEGICHPESTIFSIGERLTSLKRFSVGLKGRSDDINGLSVNDDLNGSSVDLKRPSVSLKGLLAYMGLRWPKGGRSEKATSW